MQKLIYISILCTILTAFICIQNVNAGIDSLKDIYAKKQDALKTLDISAVSKYVTSNVISSIKKSPDPKAMLYLMNYHSPLKYTTGKETIDGDNATMEISGTARNPELKGAEDSFTGNVLFKKEGSVWKVEKEDLKYKQSGNYIKY